MSMSIKRYSEHHIEGVKAFNARLRDAGIAFQFPEHHISDKFPQIDNSSLYQEYFLVVENGVTIRGGYILKHQEFLIGTETVSIGNYQLPLSEGTTDNQYNMVSLQMLTDALKRQPLLYALGMGGVDRPLPQMLAAVGWKLQKIPFFFRVCQPNIFLRQTSSLRRKHIIRLLCDIAATTGVGYLGIKLLQASNRKKASRLVSYKVDVDTDFNNYANAIWNSSSSHYSFCAIRTRAVLDLLYPQEEERFIRLTIYDSNNFALGWAVLLNSAMSGHKQFGDMRVGSIIDCCASPEFADTVIAASTDYLEKRGVDIIISNQANPWWYSALANNGYLKGPSNFALATSKELTRKIAAADENFNNLHINRGDGDGPIHL